MNGISVNAMVADPESPGRRWDIARHPATLFSFAPLVVGPIWLMIHNAVGTSEHSKFIASLAGCILVQTLCVVVCTDLHRRKIPNWATYPAFAWGLGLNIIAAFSPQHAVSLGAVGWEQSMTGGFGMLALMFVLFSFSGGGAGDVKLSAVIGSLLGWDLSIDALLYSFVVAGGALLIYSIWMHGPLRLVKILFRTVGSKLLPLMIAAPDQTGRKLMKQKFPLAPYFAAGTALALYFNMVS